MKKYVLELENKLNSLPKRTSKQIPESYIGGGQSKLKYIGLRVPDLRKIINKGFSFSNVDEEKLVKILDYIWWNSNCYEVISISLSWFYDSKNRSRLKLYWPILKKWSKKIDNWAHSDTLSGIYSRILEDDQKLIYPTLVKWNSSTNPWIRRLSIISLLYYSSQRKKYLPFEKIILLLNDQIEFDHYYVQKGVGWTLRETYNVYPEKTFKYIKENVLKLTSVAFSSATEKMTSKEKNLLKKIRKTARFQLSNTPDK